PGVPQSRQSGAGVYGGVLVVLIAGWALARSLAKQNNPFTEREQKFIWFWAGAALVSLLFAFGRHAPFYRILYSLPYSSTIRIPYSFMHPFPLSLVTLFAYGLHGLSRQYLERNLLKSSSISAQLKSWWATVSQFEKRWTFALAGVLLASLFGWLLY